jgi:hypothetical protein
MPAVRGNILAGSCAAAPLALAREPAENNRCSRQCRRRLNATDRWLEAEEKKAAAKPAHLRALVG